VTVEFDDFEDVADPGHWVETTPFRCEFSGQPSGRRNDPLALDAVIPLG
jgi:hypothetical protein